VELGFFFENYDWDGHVENALGLDDLLAEGYQEFFVEFSLFFDDFLIFAAKSSSFRPFPINLEPVGFFDLFHGLLFTKSSDVVFMKKIFVDRVDFIGDSGRSGKLF
jgi:hypothetical protein